MSYPIGDFDPSPASPWTLGAALKEIERLRQQNAQLRKRRRWTQCVSGVLRHLRQRLLTKPERSPESALQVTAGSTRIPIPVRRSMPSPPGSWK